MNLFSKWMDVAKFSGSEVNSLFGILQINLYVVCTAIKD